jgi:exopolysaccharide biosynthesis polyprenyl glycosylphosphotransferase
VIREAAAFRAALQRLHLLIVVLGDSLGLLCGFGLAYLLRFANPWLPYSQAYAPAEYLALILQMVPLGLLVFATGGLYSRPVLLTGNRELRGVVAGCSVATLALVVLAFSLAHDSDPISRGFLVLAWIGASVMVCSGRVASRLFVTRLRTRGHLLRPALVLGTRPRAAALAAQLAGEPRSGLRIVGWVADPTSAECTPDCAADRAADLPPFLGTTSKLVELVELRAVAEVVIVPDGLAERVVGELVRELTAHTTAEIRLVSGLYELLTTGVRVEHVAGMTLLTLNRVRLSPQEQALKQALDLALLVLLVPLWVPLLAVAAIAVRLDGPGPLLHRRRVLGLHGRPFTALKFRTMRVDADTQLERLLCSDMVARREFEQTRKLRQDPRITPAGHWLRRFSLDELAQLLNVLRGQMSFVGPRITAPEEALLYEPWSLNPLTVKPGLTGPWQVMGRGELPYEARVQLSMEYIRNYSLWADLQILLKTVPAVLSGRGAF